MAHVILCLPVPNQILRVRVGELSGGGVGFGDYTAGGRQEGDVTGAERAYSWALPPPFTLNLSPDYRLQVKLTCPQLSIKIPSFLPLVCGTIQALFLGNLSPIDQNSTSSPGMLESNAENTKHLGGAGGPTG